MAKYALIAYLDENISQKIREIQREIAEFTDSRHCRDYWEPHITIGDGLEIDENNEEQLFEKFRESVKEFSPFEIKLKGICFENDRPEWDCPVIYVGVKKSEEIEELAKSIKKNVSEDFEAWYRQPWPYYPHVTLA